MFPWNIAKSAEEMFSQWAIKRVCKFLLKKKLGQFILGDVDLGQLDVQLSAGTIQLSDVALNVGYLNQKLGAASAFVVKEGSIGSLLVKMPWKDNGCQIDIDELELVLGPCVENNPSRGVEAAVHNQDGNHEVTQDIGKFENETVDSAATSASLDVHEGVKTIAKMVKWLLTSFHVKVRKLIVAFDPCLEKDEKKTGFRKALVLRIDETECGTCVSEDDNLNGDANIESFLGMSRLTNFIKFRGAVIELLQMDDVEHQTSFPSTSGSVSEMFSGLCPSDATTPILTGEGGGFSGTVQLSMPWKNGSLDIHRVDADVYIDPIELRFHPSTINWFLLLWESLKSLGRDGLDGRECIHHKTTESVSNLASYCHSSSLASAAAATDEVIPDCESFAADIRSTMGQEMVTDILLPGAHLISDWVPSSVNNLKHSTIEELDFGASVDQFFECFDGVRSYQSALGNSGILNWTCSVFSAITAASTLASGSMYVPSEQHHVETNLKATVAGISVVFAFHDENPSHSCDLGGALANVGSDVHYLGAECRDMLFVLQVSPQSMKFEVTLKHIEVADYFRDEKDVTDFACHGYNSTTLLVQHLQDEVQGALPPFSTWAEDCNIGIHRSNSATIENDLVKVMLLRTSGVTHCLSTVNSSSVNGSLARTTAFSLKLPPFVFWVNFQTINALLDLSREFGNSIEMNRNRNDFPLGAFTVKYGSSQEDMRRGSGSCSTSISSRESLRGNILLPNARVILCFPFENDGSSGCYSTWDQFVVLDLSAPSSLDKGIIQDVCSIPKADPHNGFSSTASQSLHLNVGNPDIYLVTSSCKDDIRINSCDMQRNRFSAHRILSATDRTSSFSVISMLWQESPVTGPWIAEKAKFLATFEDSRTRNKFTGKGYEFASVTTVKDRGDLNSSTRREMILSSAFFLHLRLSPVTVNLSSSQYNDLHRLINQVKNGLLCASFDPVSVSQEASVTQMSILVECDSVEISINPYRVETTKSSLQSELPGSWYSLTLKIQKFELLSVSNIGGIKGAKFLWLAHGEGKLWGSITSAPEQEFLLILCSNSTMKRGDGKGLNKLSSRLAGSDIIHLWDPESVHSYTSITVRCSTVIAVGGRLDWLEAISSFFSLPAAETAQPGHNSSQNENLSSSFFLNLVDIGLSYEPYFKHLLASSDVLDSCPISSAIYKEEVGGQYVACMLAASSLNLSNTTMADSTDNEYKIRFQDLGLLVCAVSEPENVGGTYSSEHLHKVGYVKVAGEALFEAILRTNCKNGLIWELECSECHIHVDTCHDTTSGLICLVSQIQRLFAPDVEESIVHLQTRWNNVQHEQERNHSSDESMIFNSDSTLPASPEHASSENAKTEHGVFALMDEICEDAFNLGGNAASQLGSCESQLHISLDGSLLGEGCDLGMKTPDFFSHNLSFNGTVPVIGLDSHQSSVLQNGGFPKFIESYYISESSHLSEISAANESPHEIVECRSKNAGNGDLERGNSGWYGDASLRIVENHILELSEQASLKQSVEGKLPSTDHRRPDNLGKARGRVLLKNVDVRWKMYAGSDWNHPGQSSANISGRDAATCLELELSGMGFQYDVFPDGEICVSKLSLFIKKFHLYDNSRDAPWRLVLGDYHSKERPRESSSKAFKLDLEAVRPDPSTPLEEYRLQVAFLPILLHLHQGQLDFLVSFFGGKNQSVDQSPSNCHALDGTRLSSTKNSSFARHTISEEALLPYFQKFDIWPVLVRVDYSPCRVDLAALRAGKYVELVNLVPWKGVELNLKHIHAVGVYGWSSVCETIIGEWLEDISQNQIHKLLQGLPTIRSLVAVSSGAAKLVSLPVKNYKDNRLIKGMQRGTYAFLRSISLEAVGLGVHLAAGAHEIFLQAEYILSNIPSVPWPVENRTKANIRSNQPKDAQQGIQQAYESLSDGFGRSASALVRTPLKKYQRGAGAGSALATAVRAAPAAAIAPASAAARAVHCALLGVRNSLDPEHKKESMEKYSGPAEPWEQM